MVRKNDAAGAGKRWRGFSWGEPPRRGMGHALAHMHRGAARTHHRGDVGTHAERLALWAPTQSQPVLLFFSGLAHGGCK